MYKKSYEKPCIKVYEVGTTAILASSGDGDQKLVPSKSKSFTLENREVTSGDADDVWE